MKKAILRAIEGGYTYNCGKGLFTKGDKMECVFSGVNSDWTVWTRKDNQSSICVGHEEALLDPLFWQSLGKAEGWNDVNFEHTPEWERHWHGFIDHLIAGKDTDSFFDNLLTNK